MPMSAELRPPVADIRAESAFANGEVSRLCIPPLAVSCRARRCYYPFCKSGTNFANYTPSGKLCSFYPIRRIGMASTRTARCMELRRSRAWHRAKRVSKLVLLRIDAIHHFVMIPYDCLAINSIPQQVADSIHTYGLMIYSPKARYTLAFVRMIYNAPH